MQVSKENEKQLKNKDLELYQLNDYVKQLEVKNAQWQSLTNKLQSSLKEMQYPALPSTEEGLSDFAEGMAMGIDILEFLKQRHAQGVDMDKMIFLAGIKETLLSERRLSQEQFMEYLARANQRVQNAREVMLTQRESTDREWLKKFASGENVKKAGNEGWFRILHMGEQWPEQTNESGEFTIAVKRQLADGTQLADSDLTGLVLQEKLDNFPDWLQVVIKETRLNGEAELAVKVNEYGEPWNNGIYIEHWIIRVAEVNVI